MKINGSKLKNRRLELGLTTRELGKLAKTTQATISNIETQGSVPKLDLAYRLAVALQKSINWMATGVEDDEYLISSKIPIIGNTQAGPDKIWDPTDCKGYSDEFVDFPVESSRYYALKVIGDSMSPRVLEGEVIIVDPISKPITGEDVVVRTKNGETMIKTLSSIRHDKIFLDSTNSLYKRIIKDVSEIESMHLVVAIARSTMIKHI